MGRMSSFPNGFTDGILMRNLPKHERVSGKVYWVGNNATMLQGEKTAADSDLNGQGGCFLKPFATIAYAISKCAAGRGDYIIVREGHTATISAAAGIAMNVAGVTLIGQGRGSMRPTINFTATASTFTMSAANCAVHNFLFTGGIDAVVSLIVVSAADCVIDSCEIRDVTGQMTLGILTTAGANRLKILNHVHKGDTAAGTAAGAAIATATTFQKR